ncbi:MAG: polysaccharide deacetylase family protein [Paenibacillaceae bacterium]
MRIVYDRFPRGTYKALTLSYDDGTIDDRTMVKILNNHGIRGTFHLNSGRLGKPGMVDAEEMKSLYKGHEISAHTVTHPHLPYIPKEARVYEIMEDRKALEAIAGYPVKGMSYPYGTVTDEMAALLPALGIAYCRTTESHHKYDLPTNFCKWGATCHHRDQLMERAQTFIDLPHNRKPQLFYVWGHSFEFERNNNWDLLEQFCALIGDRDEIWYATNKEIVDYMKALERLELSVDGSMIFNPSSISVWISIDGESTEVVAGQLLNTR